VVITVKQTTELSVAIPAEKVPSGSTKFKVLLAGTRVSGDTVSYSISNGTDQMTDLALGTQYPWAGAGIPNLMTFKIIPADEASPAATKITSYALFFE
jgi:hypothetical protein